jgi:hypothetical protein
MEMNCVRCLAWIGIKCRTWAETECSVRLITRTWNPTHSPRLSNNTMTVNQRHMNSHRVYAPDDLSAVASSGVEMVQEEVTVTV